MDFFVSPSSFGNLATSSLDTHTEYPPHLKQDLCIPVASFICAMLAEIRYKPCQVLSDHQVPYVIWFEDALQHYGVPTFVFDLYLLVPDLDEAAALLVEAGWVIDAQVLPKIGNAEVELPQ